MRVMTFNLRFENDRDGDNAWENRRDQVVDVVKAYRPDILGTQEGKWNQLMFLKENLPDYRAHLPEREPDPVVQSPTLFVKDDRLEITGGRDFWLSTTPDVHLSKDWDSAFPRMLSYARLWDKKCEKVFYAGVTHLDHMGAEARYNQAKIAAEWANELDLPVMLMGDFNDTPDSGVHRVLTRPETVLSDTWALLEKTEGPDSFTHHGFKGVPQVARMDWILVSAAFNVVEARVIYDQEKGFYPSDHFPYMAVLSWSE